MFRTRCQAPGCGRKLLWVKNERGMPIALDEVAVVYEVSLTGKVCKVSHRSFVDHLEICAAARGFKAEKK